MVTSGSIVFNEVGCACVGVLVVEAISSSNSNRAMVAPMPMTSTQVPSAIRLRQDMIESLFFPNSPMLIFAECRK